MSVSQYNSAYIHGFLLQIFAQCSEYMVYGLSAVVDI